MSLKGVDCSVVVLAHDHNPTILHPEFLRRCQIVEPSDEFVESEIVCTPALSSVRLRSNLTIVVQQGKLQIADLEPKPDFGGSRVASMAISYVEALPQVRFTAVGLNLTAVLENAEPSQLMLGHFVKDGPWKERPSQPVGVKVAMAYATDLPGNPKLTISYDDGVARIPGENSVSKGIVIRGNYHYEISNVGTHEVQLKAVKEYIGFFGSCAKMFLEDVSTKF